MNPISAFFVENIIAVYFFYGLAFFSMGLALVLASRQTSAFTFARAIPFLAVFGLLHGLHEWVEMFQKIAALSGRDQPTITEEVGRLALLTASFVMLFFFALALLRAEKAGWYRKYWPALGLLGLWVGSVLSLAIFRELSPQGLLAQADVLSRYSLGIPAALVGAWALMKQQHAFREQNMSQFGRDLVWCTAALFLYGVIGQLFVRQTALFPSTLLNSNLFLSWFGIPVQLFRGLMAVVLAIYVTRALRIFDVESRQQAEQIKLKAQAEALAAERRACEEVEALNEDLRLIAHELSFLLELSNLVAVPMSLSERLQSSLAKIIQDLNFPLAGLILLLEPETEEISTAVSIGFPAVDAAGEGGLAYQQACNLGKQCIARGLALCRHEDGKVIEFVMAEALQTQRCRRYQSPTIIVGLPLTSRTRIIGCLVLARPESEGLGLSYDDFKLMVGIGQQLGLSIENARLYEEAQKREAMLGRLLHQVVDAQEAERQRIARELHDATGQSLTAIALGLRGIESILASGLPLQVGQIRELTQFGTSALGELRQIISDLRPPQLDDLGLVPALRWHVQSFEKRYGITARFIVEGEPVRLPSEYETVLFRITQEALRNVAKHAQASQVMVTFCLSPRLVRLIVVDDGQGFDPTSPDLMIGQPNGWGLLGIRERAILLGGRFEIESVPNSGTRLQVTVPLERKVSYAQDTATAG